MTFSFELHAINKYNLGSRILHCHPTVVGKSSAKPQPPDHYSGHNSMLIRYENSAYPITQ